MPAYKIASGDLKNIPLLRHVAKIGKPMIVSTGGGTMDDVQRAYDVIMPINPRLCLLQCTCGYPAEFAELDMRVITTYREKFPEIVIGYSGHDNGIAMPVAAYMLAARIIEKHFTLDRSEKGYDYQSSLNPEDFYRMVELLRQAEVARAALDAGASAKDQAFYEGKIAAASFFARNVLPKIAAERQIAEATDNALMDVPESAF